MLCAYVAKDFATWSCWLPLLKHSYNSTKHSSTPYVLFQLLYGFTLTDPLDLANPWSKHMQLTQANNVEVDDFLTNLEVHCRIAQHAIAQAQAKQAKTFDAGRRVQTLKEGDLALINPHLLDWLESKGTRAKLHQCWIGCFWVEQRVSQNSYQLWMLKLFLGSNVFNIEHMRLYTSLPDHFGKRAILPDTHKFIQIREEPNIEDIIAHQYNCCHRQIVYKIRYKGYLSLADKWLTAKDLRDAPAILTSYQLWNSL
jgi:hypothetical protein